MINEKLNSQIAKLIQRVLQFHDSIAPSPSRDQAAKLLESHYEYKWRKDEAAAKRHIKALKALVDTKGLYKGLMFTNGVCEILGYKVVANPEAFAKMFMEKPTITEYTQIDDIKEQLGVFLAVQKIDKGINPSKYQIYEKKHN